MAEYIVGRETIARVTVETWLGQYWHASRTLRGEDTGLTRAQAGDFLRDQALGNPSHAIRRRCWLAMEEHGISGMDAGGDVALDDNRSK
ncbi:MULTISPECIES: hypothetical protein [unclassified Ensifer]|uniref:hypothetical protein n=1 Tax=unclassified Ensifer TaxID=2633371 RepID=UPI0008137417|nr:MULTISPECIES: hypothetical protein [unclassified Ensifer]OCP22426.1 hypothetical protein BC361_24535 [Ensifer sp. LC54]OCP22637.1 hypothetical protein BC363_26670 [Ensifer sp. LC384]